MKMVALLLLGCVSLSGVAQSAETPKKFRSLLTAIKWFSVHCSESPRVSIVETGKHHVVVMWDVPNKQTHKTPVLTLIKKQVETDFIYVYYESLDSWPTGIKGEPIEHFGRIEYDKDADMLTYFTNVKRQLLLQSLAVTESYNRMKSK